MYKLCVFGGTTEGRELVEFLNTQPCRVTACVATEYGQTLLPEGENLTVSARPLPVGEIGALLQAERFDLVIDATHPYAASITRSIAAACEAAGVEHWRLLRGASEAPEDAVFAENTDEAVRFLSGTEGNILLTTGSKELSKFAALPDFAARCWARVLPLPASLIKLFSIFRSSGRLFWPIYYLLMLLTLVGLARLKGRWLLAGAALLAVVQVWDVSPGMVQRSAAMQQAMQTDAFPTEMESDFWQAAQQYTAVVSMDEIQDDALHLALFAADNGMTTNDPFAARYDETALVAQRETLLAELAAGTVREDTMYLFAEEGAFLQAVEPVKDNAWCGRVTSTDGTCSWYVIAPGLRGQNFDALCTPYDENYPLRLADYTDALWNRGVLDETKQTVCFADSPFVRRKLEHASVLCADGKEYTIKTIDDHDAGWLMVTLDIPDATVLWDKELESK